MARSAGFEPATVRLEGGCSIQLSYERIFCVKWGGRWGLNPRPPESQSGALPTELRPPLTAILLPDCEDIHDNSLLFR